MTFRGSCRRDGTFRDRAVGSSRLRHPTRASAAGRSSGSAAMSATGGSLLVVCALAVAILPWGLVRGNAQGAGNDERLRQEALELTNAARSEEGLSELGLDRVLNEAAQVHAADMLDRNFHAHVTPDGETPRDRFRAAGGDRWAASGENIATCSGCEAPADVARVRAFHSGWMQSPGHRANILSEGFDAFGFAVAGEGDRIYAVQIFSGPGATGPEQGDARPVSPEEILASALAEANRRRAEVGLNILSPSAPLDILAGRVLDAVTAGDGALPEDLFGLLPDGSVGWTSLSVRAADRGGAGSDVVPGDVADIVADWTSDLPETEALGGEAASHLGFAIRADGSGRATAVAVFGGKR